MTPGDPTPRALRVVDLRIPQDASDGHPSAAGKHSVRDTDRTDDDLVALRSAELLTPLASIVSFAELIDSDDVTDTQRHLYAGTLLREGHRLRELIDNALALQSLETGHQQMDLAPVDMQSLIQRAVKLAGKDERRPISAEIPDNLPLVSANDEAILKVMANFLSNARRFSPDGGAITVFARSTGDMVEVTILDHGVGVLPEALHSLFRKFYRADNGVRKRGPGAGLGLAMNHRIIEAHGGQVEVDSEGRGEGARFTFTLPISRPRRGSGEVLIVEHDAGFASLMKAEFAAQGLSSVRAADAETAEHMLIDMTPRAIILDLSLPGLQGEDFLARMRASDGTRLLVVVMTAKNLAAHEVSALEAAGAIAVLPKEAGAPQAAVTLVAEALGLAPVSA
ncbi:MAG TPA: ATP-binding protein [Clostridia bacterium]|nr:ATP-binding protein [Clostridia bacterium]